MVKSCCIKKCKSVWTRNGDVTFHSFPKDPESFTAFASAIPPNFVTKITKYSYICSKHFTVDSFQSMATPCFKHRLKTKAVPSLFDNDFKCSTITTPTNVVKPPMSIDDTDNEMIVESGPSDSIVNMSLYQERALGDHSSYAKPFQSEPNVSLTSKQEIGVQTSQQYLPPSDEVVELRNKIKVLQKRLHRRETRLRTMSDLVRHLKNNGKCTDTIEDELKDRFTGFSLDILANELKNSSAAASRKRYSEDIKRFALTLYFYSPKAYNFIRTKLNLPHSSMLRKWLSSYNSEPGFISEVLSHFGKKVRTNVKDTPCEESYEEEPE